LNNPKAILRVHCQFSLDHLLNRYVLKYEELLDSENRSADQIQVVYDTQNPKPPKKKSSVFDVVTVAGYEARTNQAVGVHTTI